MKDINLEGLSKLGARACVLGKAYQLRREALWWSNLATLVLPAVLATAAAIVTALPPEHVVSILELPLGSALAGMAAILIAVHKALKCEEHQAEGLRLVGAYGSIALDAEAACQSSRNHGKELSRLSEKMTSVIENATATVPDRYIDRAKAICKSDGYA